MDRVNNGYNINIKYNVRESRDFWLLTFSGVERRQDLVSSGFSKKQKTENGAVQPDVPSPAKDKEDKKKKPESEKGKKEKAANGAPSKKTLNGGLVVEDTKVGTGKAAKPGNRLSMRYIGKLANGKVFDKNTKGKPVSILQ